MTASFLGGLIGREDTQWSCHTEETLFVVNKDFLGNNLQSRNPQVGVSGFLLLRFRMNVQKGESCHACKGRQKVA